MDRAAAPHVPVPPAPAGVMTLDSAVTAWARPALPVVTCLLACGSTSATTTSTAWLRHCPPNPLCFPPPVRPWGMTVPV
eukprot:5724471-Prymnesium_polylepis.1